MGVIKVILRLVGCQNTNSFIVLVKSKKNLVVSTVKRHMFHLELSKCTYGHTHCRANVSFVGKRSQDLGCCKVIFVRTLVRNHSDVTTAVGHSQIDQIYVHIYRRIQTLRNIVVNRAAKLFRACHCY
jgi:hypothetical protein